jgi:L-ascorbate metabolism protein UlaG (beta-lactamase superfamily)
VKDKPIRIRRLGWSGVEIEFNNETLLIDYILDTSPLAPLRSPSEPFPSSSNPGAAAGALLTHLHADHADPVALSIALRKGAPVLRPETAMGTDADKLLTAHAEEQFAGSDLAVEIIGAWEERQIGPFKISSVPAVDGFGDPQISWIIECDEYRIIHAGDTLFHGLWWRIANKHGPFDVAFLPINAPIVNFPHLQPPSPIEAVMTPEQAAAAANIIRAKKVVPIHYRSLHKPPMYIETDNAVERLRKALHGSYAQDLIMQPGEWFGLDYKRNGQSTISIKK